MCPNFQRLKRDQTNWIRSYFNKIQKERRGEERKEKEKEGRKRKKEGERKRKKKPFSSVK